MSTTEIARPSALAQWRVAVVMGGTSGEREVSCVSGRGVLASLERSVQAGRLGAARGVEIDAQGRWCVDGATWDGPRALVQLRDVDAFFIALHGGEGEDGTLQGLLACAGRRHTGSGVAASALCMDKLAVRGIGASIGLPVAPGVVIGAHEWAADPARALERATAVSTAADGWVVKPRRGGSSVDTSVLRDHAQLAGAISRALRGGDDALIEARIRGVEVSCGVLEEPERDAVALPAIEIRPKDGKFFDYEQKYAEGGADEQCPPRSVDAQAHARVREAARRLHIACGCSGYSRSDYIVRSDGTPVLLEINTLPGMTPRSLFPQEAAAVGIGYDELCLRILEVARSRGARP